MTKPSSIFALLLAACLTVLAGCESMPTQEGAADTAYSESGGSSAPGQSQSVTPGGGAVPAAPKSVTLPAGTAITVRTTNTLSSGTVQAGESFAATLEAPIVDGTWVIAPQGANVRGVIAHSNAGGKVKGRADLGIRLTSIQTASGRNLEVNTTTYSVAAQSTKKKDAKKIGIASGVGAAVGAIVGGGKGAAVGAGAGAGAGTAGVLMTHGDSAVIRSESVVTFQLSDPVTVSAN